MEVYRRSSWLLLLLVELQLFFIAVHGVHGEVDVQGGPSESECRPHIEKALKQLETGDSLLSSQDNDDSKEDIPTIEITTDDSDQPIGYGENEDDSNKKESDESIDVVKQENMDTESTEAQEVITDDIGELVFEQEVAEENYASPEDLNDNDTNEDIDTEQLEKTVIEQIVILNEDVEQDEVTKQSKHEDANNIGYSDRDDTNSEETGDKVIKEVEDLIAVHKYSTLRIVKEVVSNNHGNEDVDSPTNDSKESDEKIVLAEGEELQSEANLRTGKSNENEDRQETEAKESVKTNIIVTDKDESNEDSKAPNSKKDYSNEKQESQRKEAENIGPESTKNEYSTTVEELTQESDEDLTELRPREHIEQLLNLDEDATTNSKLVDRTSEIILRDLKKLYDNAIKPLEILYKYKDLSNRHFGDSEIFAKPLILFMGPWSGGKSTIINYLVDIEHTEYALHTGAEPSPAYFNILTHAEEPQILGGTQLAADYTFSGLQKFGQGFEDRLRGYRLPSKLLEKVNIVEIPGILEVRKQVSRVFPFNDACQWFIDRADIIFLVYDPSKLDVGPETEAILDQLKGREHQTRIILNKADQVKPEELLRVQGALIWNISPLMSSAQPPIMYTTSLWSKPYESWAPVRLLQAQERAFLRDIRSVVDKRIDNKIASARRFAVRVRNHAKMVDCYLTTYYNHKSVFGNRKQISDEIINHPQDFHIYEGLSTLTNISRYDLPDPDVYRDFFRLNALYDFQQLSATCTYFRGCPINRLDIAIAYDLPELVGKYKKMIEVAIHETIKTPMPKS